MASSLGQALSAELKENFRIFWRTFWKSALIFTGLFMVYFIVSNINGEFRNDLLNPIFLLVLLGYCLFMGVIGGVAVGFLRLTWYLMGWWTLLVIALVPLTFKIVFWLLAGTLAQEISAIGNAFKLASAGADWSGALDVGAAGRAGPIVLLFIIPVLLGKGIAVILNPLVLAALGVYLFTVVLGLILSLAPSFGITVVIFFLRLFKRVRERYGAIKTGNQDIY